jgi:oligopeptide/dipeptide ABC transporter ATP-binding protein
VTRDAAAAAGRETSRLPRGSAVPGQRPLVELEGLRKVYATGGKLRLFGRPLQSLVAVDDVTLHVERGEILGLVGESGCGKSTLGLLTLRLIEPTRGRIYFDGREITRLNPDRMRPVRRHMQIVFQDPLASLNPRMKVRDIVAEPLRVHGIASGGAELTERAADLLAQVGLGREHLFRYPHEFSGGQRQRVCIARALAPRPSFIVADEPLSALDVSVQAQIINLLLTLQEELGLAFLFISHDLNVVGVLAGRVAVMYLGLLVEVGATADVYGDPLHPYSKALIAAVARPDPSKKGAPRPLLAGELPSATAPPEGCTFHPRCPNTEGRCREEPPELREVAPGRWVRCHLV